MRISIAMLAGLIVAAGMVFWFSSNRPARPTGASDGGGVGDRAARSSSGPSVNEAPRRTAAPAVGGRTEAEIEQARRRRLDLERQIRTAQVQRSATRPVGGAENSGGGGGSVEPEGTLDKEYIRSGIRELMPLFKECYTLALEKQPTLGGKLMVRFKILGEKELGGMVEKVEIVRGAGGSDGGPEAVNAQLEECMQATIESITFKPPKGGGSVTVNYPFLFATSDE